MQCDFCNNEANIEIVTFVNGEAKTIRICSSCYKEKLEEMMKLFPKGFGGGIFGSQLQDMLDRVEKNGPPFDRLQIQFKMPSKFGDDPGSLNIKSIDDDDQDGDHDEDEAENFTNFKINKELLESSGMFSEDTAAFFEKVFDQLEKAQGPIPDLESHKELKRKMEGKGVQTARDSAFEAQYESLIKQRNRLVRRMNSALAAEEYEECAEIRDEISKVSDSLVKLNEERKKPNGV